MVLCYLCSCRRVQSAINASKYLDTSSRTSGLHSRPCDKLIQGIATHLFQHPDVRLMRKARRMTTPGKMCPPSVAKLVMRTERGAGFAERQFSTLTMVAWMQAKPPANIHFRVSECARRAWTQDHDILIVVYVQIDGGVPCTLIHCAL